MQLFGHEVTLSSQGLTIEKIATRFPDKGFDSPEEIQIAKKLAAFNKTTGPLAGACVFRITEVAGQPCSFAWINPHFDDPIAVIVFNDKAQWCFADNVEEAMNSKAWSNNFDANTLAPSILEIVQKHSPKMH